MQENFLKPPKGSTNIDMFKNQFHKLEITVGRCDTLAPSFTFAATRWLENAFYSREIIEDDYNTKMMEIKKLANKFDEECSCNTKTQLS